MKILHITPHLGGGVGSVICAWIISDNKNLHKIISLDKNIQNNFNKQSINLRFDGLFFNKDYDIILQNEVSEADIVLLHFWNHPLTYDLIFNHKFPKCRLIIWSHVSGLNVGACIPAKIVEFVDKFVFTSPVSYESSDILKLPSKMKEKLDVVWSSSLLSMKKNKRKNFDKTKLKIGYVGTADYSKLNKSFLSIVKSLNLHSKVDFYSNDSQEQIKKQAFEMCVLDKINFNGRAERIELPFIYNSLDILLYPLNPNHYGTCEQVLGEAMSYGCIPIVLNNKPEKYIVKNRKNGFLVDSTDEIQSVIDELFNNSKLHKQVIKNAIKSSYRQYSLDFVVKKWRRIFNEMIRIPKHLHNFLDGVESSVSPAELYAISQGSNFTIFSDYINNKDENKKKYSESRIKDYFNSAEIFKSKSKGSVFQYLQFFPKNKVLLEWNNLLKDEK